MRAIIVDDERLARQELKSLLENNKVEIIAECANHIEAKKEIEELRPDVVFLDIQMPEKNGFELLDDLDYIPEVVFVTAYDEFAINAFKVNAFDYLLKPIDESVLKSTIEKLSVNFSEKQNTEKLDENDKIFIKDGNKCWFVELLKIRRFDSVGNYSQVYFDEFKPLILKSLNNLEEKLNEKLFFRANRKTIINLNFIDKIEPSDNGGLILYMSDGEIVDVSRRQSVRFKNVMSL